MLFFLIFLGIAIPIAELSLLFFVSQFIGFWGTVGIIVGTGVLGAILWRIQGMGVMGRMKRMMSGGSPADVMLDGAMLFFAGGLLLTPGIITDLVGFSLVIPWTRSFWKKAVYSWLKQRMIKMQDGASFQGSFFQMHSFTSMHPGQSEANSESDPQSVDIVEGHIVESAENNDGSENDDSENDEYGKSGSA